jgi:hypothetical protein
MKSKLIFMLLTTMAVGALLFPFVAAAQDSEFGAPSTVEAFTVDEDAELEAAVQAQPNPLTASNPFPRAGLSGLPALNSSISCTPDQVIYFSDLEANNGGWEVGGYGDWEWGTPTPEVYEGCDESPRPEPSGAFSGDNVWANNLDGCHDNSGEESTLSRTFDFTEVEAPIELSWQNWYEIFYSFDLAELYVNGDKLWEVTTSVPTPDWQQETIDLSAYAGQADVTVTFRLFATTVVNRMGWYVDDIAIAGCINVPEIVVDPTSFDITVFLGYSTTLPLTISNPGTAPLHFEIYEIDGGSTLTLQNKQSESIVGPEQSQSPEADNGTMILSGPLPGTRGQNMVSALVDPWITISTLPLEVSRPGAAVVDGTLYVIGGESTGGTRLGQVQIYDPDVDMWDNVSAPVMPTPVSNLCAVALDGNIYVSGGWTGAVVETALQVFDPTANNWETIATDPLPAARYGLACASHEGKLYVFGGWDGSVSTDTAWVFDPAGSEGTRWSALDNAPFSGAYGAALSVNGLIFYGGISDNFSGNFADVAAYDPLSDSWTTYPSLQEARGGAGMWAIGDKLYIGGGGWASYLTTVEVYDITMGTGGSWEFTNPLNQGRRTFAYATDTVNGHLYAAAGWAGAYLTHAEKSDFLLVVDVPWLSQQPKSGTTDVDETTIVDVTFDAGLPITQAGVYYATMVIINDSINDTLMIPVTMTVVEPEFGVLLSGDTEDSGEVGSTVVYSLSITNTGDVLDTFDLAAAGTWIANLSDDSLTLDAGESTIFTVSVEIPSGAANDDEDVTTVTATSQSDPTASDSSMVTTTAIVPTKYIYLPLTIK